jgi:hypothetical protein
MTRCAVSLLLTVACAGAETALEPRTPIAWTQTRDAEKTLTQPRSASPAPRVKPRATRRRTGPTRVQWAELRRCESGGDYRARSATGRFTGAYQFDRATWASVGGRGIAGAASPAEQDARALLLWTRRGWQPWGPCGRRAAAA